MKNIKLPLFLLFGFLTTSLFIGAQIRVIDNKGTVSIIDTTNWKRIGTSNDIYAKLPGNIGIGGMKVPVATLHNAGSTILGMTAVSDVSASYTLPAALVDNYSGVVVTQTTVAASITLSDPTNKTVGRLFTISNASPSTYSLSIVGSTLNIAPGKSGYFVWDGVVWSATSALTQTDADIMYVKVQTSNPSAALSPGSTTYELAPAGTKTIILNWNAGRQAPNAGAGLSATANITSVVITGNSQTLAQTFTNPATPTTVATTTNGTQSVTFDNKTNVTYTNTVETSDNKTATASVTYSFLPRAYYGYSATETPGQAEILAAAGGGSPFSSAKALSPTVTLPATTDYYNVFYAYPATYPALTIIKDAANNNVTGAFTLSTVSVTNASGYTQTYNVYTSIYTYSNTTIYAQYQ